MIIFCIGAAPLHINSNYTTLELEELNITCIYEHMYIPSNNNSAPRVLLTSYSWLFTPLGSTSLHTSADNETLNWTSNSIRLRPSRSHAGLYYCIARFNVTDDIGVVKTLTSIAYTRLFVKCAFASSLFYPTFFDVKCTLLCH